MPLRTEEQQRKVILSRMTDEQLQCKSGHRHRFPSDELRPGKTPPRQMSIALRDGVYTIEEDCLRGCGRVRVYSTLRGGAFDRDVRYSYRTRDDRKNDWVTLTGNDPDVTGRDAKAELFERSLPQIRAAARKAAS